MQKIFLISGLLLSSLVADSALGTPITAQSIEKPIVQKPLRTRINPNQQTKVLSNNQRSFKKDHHRYDKRYENFDYERNTYYDDEGYEYGYYDTTGYFYNNIFFTYGNGYTYRDRYHRRGYFRHNHPHRRHYIHHRINDWNRVHCYREPNVIVYGNYYDRSYYPRNHRYSNSYYHNDYRSNYHGQREHTPYRRPARMSVTRMNGHTNSRTNSNHASNNRANSQNQNNHRNLSPSNYSNHTRMNTPRANSRPTTRPQPRRSTTRMTTRRSSNNHKNRHIGMSK